MHPNNLVMVMMGVGLLWVGWFGFNAGSALGSGELASIAFINTNTAAAAATLGWLLAEWAKSGKPTILGAASGAVAGLVAITPGAGFVTPAASIVIGALGGVICYAAVSLKPRLGYDDALDVVGVHFVGGTIGALLTGVFASTAINSAIPSLTLSPDIKGGLLYGNPALVWKQLLAVLATYAYCGVGTLVILVAINAVSRLRASEEEEIPGMDLSQHSERAYHIGSGETIAYISREPRPANIPPMTWDRFTVAVEGVDPAEMTAHWRKLCQDNGGPPSGDFKNVYSKVSMIRGNRFRFRGGDRESVRQSLEQLFKAVEPGATARLVNDAPIEPAASAAPVGVA